MLICAFHCLLVCCRNGVFGMGVADGVYMWKELGIDSGTMSRTLMETAMHLVQAGVEDVVQGKWVDVGTMGGESFRLHLATAVRPVTDSRVLRKGF